MTPRKLKRLLLLVLGTYTIGCNLHDSTKVPQYRTPIWVYNNDSAFFQRIHFALCSADNTLKLKFPCLTVQPVLQISDEHGPNYVLISVTRGEFVRSADTSIKVTFDDKTPELWPIEAHIETDDHFVVLYHPKAFITKLKKAKYLTVEIDIKDNGLQVMKFYVAGLQWNVNAAIK